MARKPKIRVSYNDDAQYLLRLEDAILRDDTRPLSWRARMAERIKALALEFLNAPEQGTEEESLPAESKKKGRRNDAA